MQWVNFICVRPTRKKVPISHIDIMFVCLFVCLFVSLRVAGALQTSF